MRVGLMIFDARRPCRLERTRRPGRCRRRGRVRLRVVAASFDGRRADGAGARRDGDERIELGTAVVPTYPRHPTALAMQALTVQDATNNRLSLGIRRHRMLIEGSLGLDYSRPIPHMKDYLTVLNGLLAGEQVRSGARSTASRPRLPSPARRSPQCWWRH